MAERYNQKEIKWLKRGLIKQMHAQKNQDLLQALSNASDYVYLFMNDLKTNLSQWSDNAVAYFALPQGYEKNTLEIWMQKIHPDDRAAYKADIEAVFDGRKARHQIQYRAQNRYGDYVWLECTGNIVKNQAGEPILFAGMITRLDQQTKYDPLTKLLSYYQFYREDEIKKYSVVLLIGMDSFRKVIQNYGYEAGDRVLVCMAEILNELDMPKRVYRMNGDEFLLVLTNGTKEIARKVFFELLAAFQRRVSEHGFVGVLHFSAAGNVVMTDACDKETLLKQLEHSMEHAKQNGGGELVFFSNEIESKHRRIHEIHEELDDAVRHGFRGFSLFYQPIKDVGGNIHTVEALLRFYSEKFGWISPVEFIPILERTRMIRPVGIWVMREAVHQCKIWNDTYGNISVGFNVSYLQLHNDELIIQLIKAVRKEKLPASQMVVELTESCKVLQPERLCKMFEKLMSQGFRVALDDFGMEYSSLTLLRDIPVTTVKIDHSFVRTITGIENRTDRVNLSIIAGIITMCKNIGIRVVVEGIENEAIAKIISEMDVDFLQGYYFSKPVPAEEVEKYFRSL